MRGRRSQFAKECEILEFLYWNSLTVAYSTAQIAEELGYADDRPIVATMQKLLEHGDVLIYTARSYTQHSRVISYSNYRLAPETRKAIKFFDGTVREFMYMWRNIND